MSKHITVLILLSIFIALNSSAEEYFIAIWGNDNNIGNASSPFRNIETGVLNALPGDTVSIMAGIYYESVDIRTSGTAENPITIRALPGENVIIKAQDDQCFWVKDSIEYINFEGLILTEGHYRYTSHGSGIRIQGNYCIVRYCNFYDDDIGVFAETYSEDFDISNHHITVEYNIFSDCGEAGVRVKQTDNCQIISNLFYRNGYLIEPAGALTFYGADSTIILNNTFWDNNGPAIHSYNSTDQYRTPPCNNTYMANNLMVRTDGGFLFRVDSNMVLLASNVYTHNLMYNGVPGSKCVQWGYNNVMQSGVDLTVAEFLDTTGAVNPENALGWIEADPLFVDPENLIFDLKPGSPALDAGILSVPEIGLQDLTVREDQSPDIGAPDMGFHHLPYVWDSNPPVYQNLTFKIYPNPGGETFHFDIQLPPNNQLSLPKIRIYNVRGVLVDCVRAYIDNPNNSYIVSWKPDPTLSSGIYFALLTAPGIERVKRLALVK